MSWSDYIHSLMDEGVVEDAGILCFTRGEESVWAAHGCLKGVTPAEIQRLTSPDRSTIFTDGVTLAGEKCRVILDNFLVDGTMNLMSKSGHNICLAKGNRVLVLVKGCKNIHGGQLTEKTSKMATHLTSCQF